VSYAEAAESDIRQVHEETWVCDLQRRGIGTNPSDGRPTRGPTQVFARFRQWLAQVSSAPAASASLVNIGPCDGFSNSR
jgi:hypothetical protein